MASPLFDGVTYRLLFASSWALGCGNWGTRYERVEI